jgi:hypothetical protein
MKIAIITGVMAATLLIAGCVKKSSSGSAALPSAQAAVSSSPIITDPVKLADMDPLAYLTHLQSHETGDCLYVERVSGGWVKQKQLAQLFQLLGSDRRCALPVFFASSPHVDQGKGSTVGREAAFLIMNFQGQGYPAPLGSRVSDLEKEALRAWWKRYGNQKE